MSELSDAGLDQWLERFGEGTGYGSVRRYDDEFEEDECDPFEADFEPDEDEDQ